MLPISGRYGDPDLVGGHLMLLRYLQISITLGLACDIA
jgi:hypothetical protein